MNASNCCWTRARSPRSSRCAGTGPPASAWRRRRPYTDGVVTGWGTVDGRTVFVYAHDFRIFGGALGEAHATKIHKIMDMAIAAGAPLVSLNDGAGARIQEGVSALAGYGGIFQRNTRASGVIPQISVMLGPCAGGAAYSPGADRLRLHGPRHLADVHHRARRGPGGHRRGDHPERPRRRRRPRRAPPASRTSPTTTSETCLEEVRYLLSLLPANNRELPPARRADDPADRRGDALLDLVPADGNRSYDMREVIEEIVDDGELLRGPRAAGPPTSSAPWPGSTARSSASSPTSPPSWPACWTSTRRRRPPGSCSSATRSTSRWSPWSTSPASCPASTRSTTASSGTAPNCSTRTATPPCRASQLILRKAYGGAYIVMDSRSIGADLAFAWPTNEIAVMGAEGAANVIFRRRDRGLRRPRGDARRRRIKEYQAELMHPYYAAERGLVDDVIDPRRDPRRSSSARWRCCAPSTPTCPPASTATPRCDPRRDAGRGPDAGGADGGLFEGHQGAAHARGQDPRRSPRSSPPCRCRAPDRPGRREPLRTAMTRPAGTVPTPGVSRRPPGADGGRDRPRLRRGPTARSRCL